MQFKKIIIKNKWKKAKMILNPITHLIYLLGFGVSFFIIAVYLQSLPDTVYNWIDYKKAKKK